MKLALERENKNWSRELKEIPPEDWPEMKWTNKPIKVFRSDRILVQVFQEDQGLIRIAANICEIVMSVNPPFWKYKDGLTWNDLQKIKNEVGYANKDAVEIFPNADDEVEIFNIRHLWVCPTPVWFAWRKPSMITIARDMAHVQRLVDGNGKTD